MFRLWVSAETLIGLLKEWTMNDEEINRAIAEQLGWRDLKKGPYDGTYFGRYKDHTLNPIPNYCGDLNAMHEAEGVLGPKWVSYCEQLLEVAEPEPRTLEVCHYWNLLHATARQRAEAFLRTVGKWRGEE
jgi:hypothetical protein